MPASPQQIEDADVAGAHMVYLMPPFKVVGKNGRAVAPRGMRMQLGEPDASGRRRPVPVPDSKHRLQFDLMTVAISQSPEIDLISHKLKTKLSQAEDLPTNKSWRNWKWC